jgi:hypothetical protein
MFDASNSASGLLGAKRKKSWKKRKGKCAHGYWSISRLIRTLIVKGIVEF